MILTKTKPDKIWIVDAAGHFIYVRHPGPEKAVIKEARDYGEIQPYTRGVTARVMRPKETIQWFTAEEFEHGGDGKSMTAADLLAAHPKAGVIGSEDCC